MIYLFITVFQLLGIGLHVAEKVVAIDKELPDDTLGQVFAKFWKIDRVTIIISGLIMLLHLAGHLVIATYAATLISGIEYYDLYSILAALVLGYGGQKIVYAFLGKLQTAALNKADKIQ